MAAWIYQPVIFEAVNRTMDCMGFTPEQCTYYQEPWHNWYVADLSFARPTVAFFMCGIGIFIIGYATTQILSFSHRSGPAVCHRGIATIRYLTYRGFHVKSLGWNTAPVGVLALGATGTAYFFCMDLIPAPYYWPGPSDIWGSSPPLATRSGWLALACMPFLFATASKANWITLVTGVTHEKLQVFHRWIAYAFLILALMHTFPFIVWSIMNHDMVYQFKVSNIFEYWTGIVALLFQAWLTFAAWGPFRNLGYEFFKAAHFTSAVIFMIVFFWHCEGTLTSWDYFVATAAVYVPCWAYPWLRTLFEYGIGQKAQISVEENGFIRIAILVSFQWQPGQHCFLRFPGLGFHALSSHPFTICSLPSRTATRPSEAVFYLRQRGGFTKKLYNRAMQQPDLKLRVLVDGPYGGIDNSKFFNSDRVVVIAGGSGAGWMLPFVEQFIRCSSSTVTETGEVDTGQQKNPTSTSSPQTHALRKPRSLRAILATRDLESCAWFYGAVNKLLANDITADTLSNLHIQVHLTGEAEQVAQSINKIADLEKGDSSSSTEGVITQKIMLTADGASQNEMRGRPNLPLIVQEEADAAANRDHSVAFYVCGPLTMQNDVRNAVAQGNLRIVQKPRAGGLYLHLEHFSWA